MSGAHPIAAPTQFQPWQPTDEQIAKAAERARLQQQRDTEDAARAASGSTTLVCIAGFTIYSEEFPAGRVVSPGEDFTVNDFDLPKYLGGKGVRRADFAG